MDGYNWSALYTARVRFSFGQSCFMFIPDKWLKKDIPFDIIVFKVSYGKFKEAYVSCKKFRCVCEADETEVQLNAKFAEKLGIKEKEMVRLQLLTQNVPRAESVVIEPLTVDDWEVLELNSSLVEKELMNQIRIVWPNQVFPIWANHLSIFVKIAETNPDHTPVLLAEFTELHIVPKKREWSESESKVTQNEEKAPTHFQFEFLRYNSKKPQRPPAFDESEFPEGFFLDNDNRSATLRALSVISSWFSTSAELKLTSLESPVEALDFEPFDFDAVLRVIPYSNPNSKNLPLVVQATTVFISADTYALKYGATNIPPCFVAVLEKVLSPEERKQLKSGGNSHKSGKEMNETSAKDYRKTKLEKSEGDKKQEPFNSIVVTVMVVKSPDDDEFDLPSSIFFSKNLIVVPKELKRSLNLEVASVVHLKSVQNKPVLLSTISLHSVALLPAAISEEAAGENFSKWAFSSNRESLTFTISNGTLVNLFILGQKYDFFLNLQESIIASSSSGNSSIYFETDKKKNTTKEPIYGFLDKQVLKRLNIKFGSVMCTSIFMDRPYLKRSNALYQEIHALRLEALGGVCKLAAKAMEVIEFWLKLRPISYISNHSFTFCGCMLICGAKGVGKSALANAICKKLVKHPYNVFVHLIQCLPLKGKRIENIAKKWDEVVSEAIHRQPSLLLFEDLDYIASCPASHEQEVGPDGVYFSSIVQIFINMMSRIINSESKIAVMVTSQSTHSLHPTLIHTKGRHMFQTVLEIPPPDVEQRTFILSSLVCSKPHISRNTVNNLPWSEIAAKTEGFVAQDLDSLVDRATHAAWIRLFSSPSQEEINLLQEDFEMALEDYVPSSLRGVPLQMQDQKTWQDVGGLKEVKKVIQQIIMWPIKYKQIFKNYSLKPQMNILLYGAPGTGKTLLANIIASECGLNFISIKGPELLSKYIGASEQAIRDLFKRASTARPCILFFDEFDSIAPRRGHDSTGVTDRVVNQLLTQLDGVESLEGVHVLAATSRPELIDPALLRPGRLDKCLLCPLPDEDERLEILKCLSSKLPLSDDIDFKFIASQTQHFSGADLQALLYTAHIKALHETQYSSSRKYSTSSDDMAYSDASDKLLYMSSVENGLTNPSYEDGKKIVQEVNVIKEKFGGASEQTSSHRSTLNVSINQKHLVQVAAEMKPSVSPQERLRYEGIFQNFRMALSGESTTSLIQNVKRVTLA